MPTRWASAELQMDFKFKNLNLKKLRIAFKSFAWKKNVLNLSKNWK